MNAEMPDDPVRDIDRLAEIGEFDLYSDEVRESLSKIARDTAERMDLPIGLVSIVLDSAQYFPGAHGLGGWLAEAEGAPVEWSFCANAVRNRDTYVVTDARTDELQHDNPLVQLDGVCAYAGAPLITERGNVLGAVCVVGTEPHEFTDGELDDLRQFADLVIAELEAHRC